MKNDLIDTVRFCFTDKIIAQLSALVDEEASGTEQALSQAVPLVLSRLLAQVEHGMAPAQLPALVHEADAANVLAHLADHDTAEHERSTNLLLDLLGDTYRTTVSQIAVAAGIRPAAGSTLLQVAATAVLGVLGEFAVENSLTPNEFMHWLQSQQVAISAAMLPVPGPAGLSASLGQAVALPQPAAVPPRIATAPARLAAPRSPAAYAPAAAPGPASGGLRWQWGALLLLAVSLGYFFGSDFLGQGQRAALSAPPAVARETSATPAASANAPIPPAAPATVPTAATNTASTPPSATLRPTAKQPFATPKPDETGGRYDQDRDTYIYDTGRPIVLALANGSQQKVGANSTENRLYTFLASVAVQVDSVNRTKGWINFDRVYFEPSKATLRPESWGQLHNIANILRTFPHARVKIGGYTDSAGVPVHNLELSEARARTAMLALANLGVPLDQMQAKGYGARYFVTPNNTLASRARNRRVSVRVLRK